MKQGHLVAILVALAFVLLPLLFITLKKEKKEEEKAGNGDEQEAQETRSWLNTVFAAAKLPEKWSVWLHLDMVTGRPLLLPSQPHAPLAEAEVVNAFNRLVCAPNILFVDIGMNSGFYSLLARARGCRVFAVEPQPSCIAMLRFAERANMISGVEVVQGVVTSSSAGPAIGDRVSLSMNHVCEGMYSLFWNGPTEVRTLTLDSLLPPERGHVALLKLDIEGFEPHALAGAQRLLGARRVDSLLVEATWWPNVFQPLVKAYELIAYVFEAGYSARCIEGAGSSDLYFKNAETWLAYGASAGASKVLAGDAEGRRVSVCDTFIICLDPCRLIKPFTAPYPFASSSSLS